MRSSLASCKALVSSSATHLRWSGPGEASLPLPILLWSTGGPSPKKYKRLDQVAAAVLHARIIIRCAAAVAHSPLANDCAACARSLPEATDPPGHSPASRRKYACRRAKQLAAAADRSTPPARPNKTLDSKHDPPDRHGPRGRRRL